MLVPTSANAEPSSTPNANTWVTNGTVKALANANGLTYIGGSFTEVGRAGGAMEDSKGNSKSNGVDPWTGEPLPVFQPVGYCGYGCFGSLFVFGFLMGLTSLASWSWRSRRSRRKRK
jgi:hypothetical protein